MEGKTLFSKKNIQRHSVSVRFVHWTAAISTFLLIFSGFGQMPMYARYYIDRLPGLGWSSDYATTLSLHYIAAAVLMFAAAYHVVFHLRRKEFDILPRRGDVKESYLIIKAMLTKGEEPPSDKYLAEQRLAYAFIAVSFLAVIITGIIKVVKNVPAVTLNSTVIVWTNNLHTLASFMLVFGIFAHLAAFIFKVNWPLVKSMFTGKIDLDYVKKRHSIWYARLCQPLAPKKCAVQAPDEGSGCG